MICRLPSRFDNKKIRLVIYFMDNDESDNILADLADALKAEKPELAFSALKLYECRKIKLSRKASQFVKQKFGELELFNT